MSSPSHSYGFSATDPRPSSVLPAVFLVSAAAIADEIFLIRLLSVRFWPHFVPLILSQAMLGFGASGIAIHLLREPIGRSPGRVFPWLVLLAAPAFDLAFRASLLVPFDPYILLWDPFAWLPFALFFLLLSVPFFLVGSAVGLPLSFRIGNPGVVYGASFAGSAAGALIALPALSLLPTESLLKGATALGFAGALFVVPRARGGISVSRAAAAAASLALILLPAPDLRLSPYKDLAVAGRLPGARMLGVRAGPSGDFRALSAPGLHIAPGLSFRFDGEIPSQAALFADGEFRGVIPQGGGADPPRYLSWFPSSLPYRLAARPEVLQLSLRGTEGILEAAANGASSLTVVEPAGEAAALLGNLRSFSGDPPASLRLSIREEGARNYLARGEGRFDIVEIHGVSSSTFSSVGIHAAGEAFLLTREGIGAALSGTKPDGMLAVSGWLKSPARESVKILRTLREEMEGMGLRPVPERVLMVRGWGSFTIVAKRIPLTPAEREAADRFCAETGFEVVWPPARGRSEEPGERALAAAVQAALIGGAEKEGALFDLRPATDDSPYFYRFLRLGAIGEFRRSLGSQWVPFLEWGVLFLLISLVVSSAVAAVLLLPPVLFGGGKGGRPPVSLAGYFSALGFGYMLVELTFLKTGILLLGDPVGAASAAIGGFSFCSGAGSMLSGRIGGDEAMRRWIFPGIAILSAGGYLFLSIAAPRILPLPAGVRVALFLAAMAPAGFLMGIPFPAGLSRLSAAGSRAIPFAWGVNGFCSVAGASLAAAGALWFGLRGTLLAGSLLYLLAGALFRRLGEGQQI